MYVSAPSSIYPAVPPPDLPAALRIVAGLPDLGRAGADAANLTLGAGDGGVPVDHQEELSTDGRVTPDHPVRLEPDDHQVRIGGDAQRPHREAGAVVGIDHPVGDRAEVEDPHLSPRWEERSEEHTYELQSLMRISYAVFC